MIISLKRDFLRAHGKYGLLSQKEVSRAELFLKILAEENKKSKIFEKIGTERLQKSFPNFAKASNKFEMRGVGFEPTQALSQQILSLPPFPLGYPRKK